MRQAVTQAVRRYAMLARANRMTPAQMALAWCYSRWFIASTIIGATSLSQLRENIDAFGLELPAAVIDEINRIHREITNPAQ